MENGNDLDKNAIQILALNGFHIKTKTRKEIRQEKELKENNDYFEPFYNAYRSFKGITKSMFKNLNGALEVFKPLKVIDLFRTTALLTNDNLSYILIDWFQNESMIYNKCVLLSYIGALYEDVKDVKDMSIKKELIYLCTDNRISSLSQLSPAYNIKQIEDKKDFDQLKTVKIKGEDYQLSEIVTNWLFYKDNTRIIQVSPNFDYWSTLYNILGKGPILKEPFKYETAIENYIGDEINLEYFDPLFIDKNGLKVINRLNFIQK